MTSSIVFALHGVTVVAGFLLFVLTFFCIACLSSLVSTLRILAGGGSWSGSDEKTVLNLLEKMT